MIIIIIIMIIIIIIVISIKITIITVKSKNRKIRQSAFWVRRKKNHHLTFLKSNLRKSSSHTATDILMINNPNFNVLSRCART